MPPRRGAPQVVLPLIAIFFMAALAAGLLALFAENKLSGLVLGGLGESFSTRLYSAPFALEPGSPSPPARLLARLDRLGYQKAPAAERPGQYAWSAPALTVYLRGFRIPNQAQAPALHSLVWEDGLWKAVAPADASGGPAWLEPEVAAELSGARKVRREPAASEEIPEALKKAVIAVEDKRFLTHWGIDLRAIARALWANARGRPVQGASTITQQLSKNIFLTPKRNLRRKLAEAGLSLYLELRYSKDRILTIYLNHIYLGQEGAVSVAGVKAAARFYFAKELRELTVAECATLAGIIRSPHRYNPFGAPEEARNRRDFVLKRMHDEGFLSAADAALEKARPFQTVRVAAEPGQRHDNDYFVAEVVRQLLPRYGEETLFRHGLSLYTTLDALLQRDAQRAVSAARPQAALIALDPRTGDVVALAGGRDFGESQFNRATQAHRQPGSAFKPFVYGAALEKGFTAATILADAPRQYVQREGGPSWDPRNYDHVYYGTATLRSALSHSLNAATLDLAQRAGMQTVVDFARRMGIESPLAADLGTALGASEVTLLELTAAYAPFANGGWKWQPRLVTAVCDAEGEVLEFDTPRREPVLEPALSFLVSSLLKSVVAEGTARSLASRGWTRPTAGKTGTTNDGRDAWFIGYTPEMLTGVWVGDDQHKAIRATGAKTAVPVWVAFMTLAGQDFPAEDFPRPEGIMEVSIDPASGLKARAGCPQKLSELFKEGTQPLEECPLHAGGVKGFFRRLFHRGR